MRAYAQKVLSAPAGHLQNLLSLGEALALLQDETVAAAQAARLGTCLRDAEDAARLAEAQEAAEGPEAAAPKKAKSDQGSAAGMEIDDARPSGVPREAAAAALLGVTDG